MVGDQMVNLHSLRIPEKSQDQWLHLKDLNSWITQKLHLVFQGNHNLKVEWCWQGD